MKDVLRLPASVRGSTVMPLSDIGDSGGQCEFKFDSKTETPCAQFSGKPHRFPAFLGQEKHEESCNLQPTVNSTLVISGRL
jgi:hypothetical protein